MLFYLLGSLDGVFINRYENLSYIINQYFLYICNAACAHWDTLCQHMSYIQTSRKYNGVYIWCKATNTKLRPNTAYVRDGS